MTMTNASKYAEVAALVEEVAGDWASLGFEKDDDGYLWAMGYAFGRETKELREDRRFKQHGQHSIANGAARRFTHYSRALVSEREAELLRLLEDNSYAPLCAAREEMVLQMMAVWSDATLSREEKQVKLAALKEEFLQAIEAERQRKADEKLREEAEAAERLRKQEENRLAAERYQLAEAARRAAGAAARRAEANAMREKLAETGLVLVDESLIRTWSRIRAAYEALSARDAVRWLRAAATFSRHHGYYINASIRGLRVLGVVTDQEASSYRRARGNDLTRMAWDLDKEGCESLLAAAVKPSLVEVFKELTEEQMKSGYELLFGYPLPFV